MKRMIMCVCLWLPCLRLPPAGHEASAEQSIPKAKRTTIKVCKAPNQKEPDTSAWVQTKGTARLPILMYHSISGKQPACAEGRIPAAYEVAS